MTEIDPERMRALLGETPTVKDPPPQTLQELLAEWRARAEHQDLFDNLGAGSDFRTCAEELEAFLEAHPLIEISSIAVLDCFDDVGGK